MGSSGQRREHGDSTQAAVANQPNHYVKANARLKNKQSITMISSTRTISLVLVLAVVLAIASPVAAQTKGDWFNLMKELWIKQQLLGAAQNFQMPTFQMPNFLSAVPAAGKYGGFLGRKLLSHA